MAKHPESVEIDTRSPDEQIRYYLEEIMIDPEHENPRLPIKSPMNDQLVLATLETQGGKDGLPPMVIVRVRPETPQAEYFNYYYGDGKVTHSKAPQNESLTGAAAQERLAAELKGLHTAFEEWKLSSSTHPIEG
jgi:hypothetical protein